MENVQEAVCLVSVDTPVPEAVADEIRNVDQVLIVNTLTF